MKKLLQHQKNLTWPLPESEMETYLSDELPEIDLCVSAYAIVIRDGALQQIGPRDAVLKPARPNAAPDSAPPAQQENKA